ncbi:hypothetical protein C8F00_4124 [Xanthomonas vasicola]
MLDVFLQTLEVVFSSIGQAASRHSWRYLGLSLLLIAGLCGFLFWGLR